MLKGPLHGLLRDQGFLPRFALAVPVPGAVKRPRPRVPRELIARAAHSVLPLYDSVKSFVKHEVEHKDAQQRKNIRRPVNYASDRLAPGLQKKVLASRKKQYSRQEAQETSPPRNKSDDADGSANSDKSSAMNSGVTSIRARSRIRCRTRPPSPEPSLVRGVDVLDGIMRGDYRLRDIRGLTRSVAECKEDVAALRREYRRVTPRRGREASVRNMQQQQRQRQVDESLPRLLRGWDSTSPDDSSDTFGVVGDEYGGPDKKMTRLQSQLEDTQRRLAASEITRQRLEAQRRLEGASDSGRKRAAQISEGPSSIRGVQAEPHMTELVSNLKADNHSLRNQLQVAKNRICEIEGELKECVIMRDQAARGLEVSEQNAALLSQKVASLTVDIAQLQKDCAEQIHLGKDLQKTLQSERNRWVAREQELLAVTREASASSAVMLTTTKATQPPSASSREGAEFFLSPSLFKKSAVAVESESESEEATVAPKPKLPPPMKKVPLKKAAVAVESESESEEAIVAPKPKLPPPQLQQPDTSVPVFAKTATTSSETGTVDGRRRRQPPRSLIAPVIPVNVASDASVADSDEGAEESRAESPGSSRLLVKKASANDMATMARLSLPRRQTRRVSHSVAPFGPVMGGHALSMPASPKQPPMSEETIKSKEPPPSRGWFGGLFGGQ